MTRKKNQRRYRQHKNVHNKADKAQLNLNPPKSEIKNLKSPVKLIEQQQTPTNLLVRSKLYNLNQPCPEGLFMVTYQKNRVDIRQFYSPKFAPRIPRLKLNFDIPEDDSDKVDFLVGAEIKDIVKKQLTEGSDNLLQSHNEEIDENIEKTSRKENKVSASNLQKPTILKSENLKGLKSETKNILPSLSQLEILEIPTSKSLLRKSPSNKISIVESIGEKIEMSETSLQTKILFTYLDKENDKILNSVSTKEANNFDDVSENEKEYLIKPHLRLLIAPDYQNKPFERINTLQQDKLYNDTFTLNSRCTLFNNSLLIFKNLKLPFPKVPEVFSWIYKKLGDFMKQVFSTVPQNFKSLAPQSESRPTEKQNFSQVLSAFHCESEKIITVLSEKVTHLSEELNQVRATSEDSLAILTREVTFLRETNEKLVENSFELAKELKYLHETLGIIRPRGTPQKFSQVPSPLSPIFTPNASLPPPPLPPPPPPLPIYNFNTQTTSNNSKKIKTKTKMNSMPVKRPSITVEDLLKVTLKKAPHTSKENRRLTIAGPRGPVVSLDMLQSVKLRSAKSRPGDVTSKSPRSRSLFRNGKSNSSPKSPPASIRSETPLSRILKQVDVNRPEKRKLFTCPTQSDTDLLKTSPNCKIRNNCR